jgi:hypothetical protein
MIDNCFTMYASELAACINMNKYKPVSEAMKQVWCRYDPVNYRKALLRNDMREPEPIKDTLRKLNLIGKVSNLVEHSTPDSIREDITNLAEQSKNILEDNDVLIEDLKSFVLTERGKISENDSLNRLEKSNNTKIRERNQKFFKRTIHFENEEGIPDKFIIGGRVDGITEDGCLVEVKNRQYKIFNHIPIYEKVQIHTYMFLTGITECKYVQSFKGVDIEEVIKFDYSFWEMVKEKSIQFIKTVSCISKDVEKQNSLILLGEVS